MIIQVLNFTENKLPLVTDVIDLIVQVGSGLKLKKYGLSLQFDAWIVLFYIYSELELNSELKVFK